MKENNTPSFEEAFARLETILDTMNSGKTSLEESLKLYEEADQLIVFCNTMLSQAEKKIEMLTKNREGELILSAEKKPILTEFVPINGQKFPV